MMQCFVKTLDKSGEKIIVAVTSVRALFPNCAQTGRKFPALSCRMQTKVCSTLNGCDEQNLEVADKFRSFAHLLRPETSKVSLLGRSFLIK